MSSLSWLLNLTPKYKLVSRVTQLLIVLEMIFEDKMKSYQKDLKNIK